jgi:cholesterol transport system auxiliary component
MTRALFLFALIALSGCVNVLPQARPAAPRYLMEPVKVASEAPAVAWSLAIDDPIATRAYDSPKIAAVREAGRLEFLGNGEWADRAPRLLQTAIIRSFENSGRILGVGDRTTLVAPTFVLHTDIRNLEADYLSGKPEARIAVYARLVNGRGKTLAARLFERRAEAGEGMPADLAKAFDAAAGGVIADLMAWTFEEGEKAR